MASMFAAPRQIGSADTAYGPGRVTTTANLGPTPGGGGGNLQALLEEVLRRKMAPAAPKGFSGTGVGAAWARGNAGRMVRTPGPERNKTLVQRAADRAQIARLNAISQPPPRVTRFVGGQRLDTLDPESFTGAQREAYLAQGSSLSPSDDPFRAEAADADFDRSGRRAAIRKRIQDMGYGFGG